MPMVVVIVTNFGAEKVVQTMMDNAAQNVLAVMVLHLEIVISAYRIVLEISKARVNAQLTGRMMTVILMQDSVITHVWEDALGR